MLGRVTTGQFDWPALDTEISEHAVFATENGTMVGYFFALPSELRRLLNCYYRYTIVDQSSRTMNAHRSPTAHVGHSLIFSGLRDYGTGYIKHPYHVVAVFYHDCDKNFVYYTLTPHNFPTVRTVYLRSHPCDWGTFHRFGDDVRIFVHENWARYFHRWASHRPGVSLISEADYQAAIAGVTGDQREPF